MKDPASGIDLELVKVKGGCFQMGSVSEAGGPDEKPVHEVCVGGFYIGRTEITQGQWTALMGSNPSTFKECGGNCPVETVSWNDAQAFIDALNARSRKRADAKGSYRLPTEAEWEFAARSGGRREEWSGSTDAPLAVAWLVLNSEGPHPVGTKAPNGLGLCDMSGNVSEWTSDWYEPAYASSIAHDGSDGPEGGRSPGRAGRQLDGRAVRLPDGLPQPPPPRLPQRGEGLPRGEDLGALGQARVKIPEPQSGRAGDIMTRKCLGLFAVALSWATSTFAAGGGPAGSLATVPAPDPVPASTTAPATPPPPPFKDPSTGVEMLFVKGGCYQMGNVYNEKALAPDGPSDEYPVHEVCLGDFYMGKYEVTQSQWDAIMGGHTPSDGNCTAASCPVTMVSWGEVQLFVEKLNRKSGAARYRLPTEAEWEYAARSGGKSERYSGGNDVESVSWNRTNSGYSLPRATPPPWSRPVGLKAPNGLGLHDMSGNVYEFTSDWYGATYYSESPRANPKGPATGESHVMRGGCAHGDPTNGRTFRRRPTDGPQSLLGFRLVRAP